MKFMISLCFFLGPQMCPSLGCIYIQSTVFRSLFFTLVYSHHDITLICFILFFTFRGFSFWFSLKLCKLLYYKFCQSQNCVTGCSYRNFLESVYLPPFPLPPLVGTHFYLIHPPFVSFFLKMYANGYVCVIFLSLFIYFLPLMYKRY